MRWNVTPRRRKPNSGRWKADRTECARRRPWAFDLPSLSVPRPA
ncbi:hypothetical protein ACFWCA_19050 [Streptomyces phaeochromogenes]